VHHIRAVCGPVWCLLLTLPAMLFHTYRPNTPAIGSTGFVVVLMTANSAVNTAARSATAWNNTQLTQIPAFMNFMSGEPATSQWCTFTDGTVLPHLCGQYIVALTAVLARCNIWAHGVCLSSYQVQQLLLTLVIVRLAGHEAHVL